MNHARPGARRRIRAIASVTGIAVVVATACSSSEKSATSTTRPDVSSVPSPTVSGPVRGGTPGVIVNAMLRELARRYDYSEREYFFSGTASAYAPDGAVGADGRWSVKPTSEAPYETRLVVRAPNDPETFNGTVFVEWFNETSGRDADPDFGFAYREILASGSAYVGVSAQAVGVIGGGAKIPIPGYNPVSLTVWDPQRYGTLAHPGDDYSYDIFSQAGQAIRKPQGDDPLAGLDVRHVIATGESQSAGRMVTYVNAIQPLADMYDGFLIHSRGASASGVNATDGAAVPDVVAIRDDIEQPVLQLQAETDMIRFSLGRQPDTDMLRTWEMAGTAHADQATLDYGISSGRQWNTSDGIPDFTTLCASVNNGQHNFVARAAFAALRSWVSTGTPPAEAPPLRLVGATIARDARGNALGGLRTPAVDVPISTLTGAPTPGSSVICSLFGGVTPFDAATLASLYPTHADYVAKVRTAAGAAEKAGFLLPEDRAIIVTEARAARVPE